MQRAALVIAGWLRHIVPRQRNNGTFIQLSLCIATLLIPALASASTHHLRDASTFPDRAQNARAVETAVTERRVRVRDEGKAAAERRWDGAKPAETGSWVSTDPLEVAGGLNLYGLDGAPSDVVDPLGLTGNPHVEHETSRRRAMDRAQEHAQVPRESKGGEPIPFSELNESSRGRNASQLQAEGATDLGRRHRPSGTEVFDHPDGHPDAGQPGVPDHHGSPHVHSTNAAGEERIFTYPGAS